MSLIVSKHGRTAFHLLSPAFNDGNCSDSESMHGTNNSSRPVRSSPHFKYPHKQRLSPRKALQMTSYQLSPVERSHLARIPFCVSFSYGADVNFKSI